MELNYGLEIHLCNIGIHQIVGETTWTTAGARFHMTNLAMHPFVEKS